MKKIKEIIIKYKGYLICILIICLSSLSIFIQNVEKNNQNKNKNSAFNTDIAVYITGEIKNSGVYYLKQGARLYDQTTPNMIQRIIGIFERKPLISKEI